MPKTRDGVLGQQSAEAHAPGNLPFSLNRAILSDVHRRENGVRLQKTRSTEGLSKTRATEAHAIRHRLNLHFKLIHNSQGMMPEDSAQPGSGMHTPP